jgi:hypothetical protein
MVKIKYDKNWKGIVTAFSKSFIEFFFPTISKDIDWNFKPEFLEEELHNAKDLPKTKRILDKLIKVKLKNGEEKWLFIHIEFQTTSGKVICLRMYEYYQIIRERYGKDVVALVIFTGKNAPKISNKYVHKNYDTSITYVFSSYIVANQSEEELISNSNPFALVVLANLYSLNSKGDDPKRYSYKEKLYELGKDRGISIADITKLHIFVTEIMKLPKHLEKKFEKDYLKTKTKPVNSMMYASPSTRELYSEMTKEIFGQSPEEMLAKLKIATKSAEREKAIAEKERVKAEKAIARAQAQARAQLQAQLQAQAQAQARAQLQAQARAQLQAQAQAEKSKINSILVIHIKFGISAEDISTQFGYDLDYVNRIIEKYKTIKK